MTSQWKQKLHLEPPKGWLNDPNGLCFYQGKYHVYFQYAPESAEGKSLKCWGHYQSQDLLNWEFTGIVLNPDIPEDKDGVYSGSAIEKEGVLHIFYTGNVKEEGNYDYILAGRGANVIHVTTGDGHSMSEKEVVLRNEDYPDFCSCHVRDPKIWKEDDGYYMVLGARTKDDVGCVLIYRSQNLSDWEYMRMHSVAEFGYMWECPDYFKVNGRQYLGISPQGLANQEYALQNVYHAGYFQENSFREWDLGFDFYAPQTFQAPDGRTILIGWMGLPDIDYTNPTTELGWQHCLTIPRELTLLANGNLAQNPVREFEKLRDKEILLLQSQELTLNCPFEIEGKVEGNFRIRIHHHLILTYSEGVFQMEFTESAFGGGRNIRKAKLAECKEVRVIVDNSSIEVYLNRGEVVMSTRFYPQSEEILLLTENVSGTVYTLNPLEVSIGQ